MIAAVVARVRCDRHRADTGQPCWTFPCGSSLATVDAVCGTRIRQALR